ncbi:hypothetical protein AWC11_17195 [Mycobacterium interjectum]|nr:hypothetical protein AWC11_17195 [Mycobacterium interjectum]
MDVIHVEHLAPMFLKYVEHHICNRRGPCFLGLTGIFASASRRCIPCNERLDVRPHRAELRKLPLFIRDVLFEPELCGQDVSLESSYRSG